MLLNLLNKIHAAQIKTVIGNTHTQKNDGTQQNSNKKKKRKKNVKKKTK